MTTSTRRQFLSQATGMLAASVAPGWTGLGPQIAPGDLLIRGGRVIDSSQNLSAIRDVLISGGRIARIAERIEPGRGRVVDASGKIVTPGLIDAHVHVYEGVAAFAIDPDVIGVAKGVTCVVDGGSAGATNFVGFRRYVADTARTRVYSLLNVSGPGLTLSNEFADLRYINNDATVRTIEANRDVIIGIKVRMIAGIPEGQDVEVMRRTREAADRANVPIMVHIGGQRSPLPDILAFLRSGDVITHIFSREGGVLDQSGSVYREVWDAVGRGVHLDVGHGLAHFDFDVAERAMDQGLLPTSISTDVHRLSALGPVFDLPHMLSKFMAIGMSVEQVIERATVGPAGMFDFGEELGTLREGAVADVAVFELTQGNYEFVDNEGQRRTGTTRLAPWAAILGGQPYG